VGTKQMVAAGAASVLGRSLHSLSAELLPRSSAELEDLARLWHRESLLAPVALYVDAQEADLSARAEGSGESVGRFLKGSDGVTFLGTREVWVGVPREQATFDVDRPTTTEQRDAWRHALGDSMCDCGCVEADLAAQFTLNVPTIERVAAAVLRESDRADKDEVKRRLWDECLVSTRPRMDALAQRVDARATWDDIVLPEAEIELLQRIAAQVRNRATVYEDWGFAERMNRGLGISALFAGASGTGKSMAAEVIANDLRLTLYRIDLSAVVSKYIGETEKNLRRLFDAAEEGGALLLFDEADALFGKRSEVKDSHDRYANIEINYLLQRMEAYPGVAILATNMKSALDTAFMRRLRFIVTFPYPSPVERREMWAKAFPASVPLGELDLDRLASLPATGAMIHNIALGSAFRAAAAGEDVSMEAVLAVARAEFRKLELPTVERQFQADPVGAGA
jgi:SpoVK/Ycf46/Vps4 family AAA+-type ATPase